MPFLELVDETLDINSSENYVLSLEVSSAGLTFCILDTLRNKYILIRRYEPEEGKEFTYEHISDILATDDHFKNRYRKVNILVPSGKFTLVPAPLYDPERIEDYFRYNHLRDESSAIISNRITMPDAFIIFSLPAPLKTMLGSSFPDTQLSIHLRPLLRHIAYRSRNPGGRYIHAHLEKSFFNLVIFDQSTLKLCNTFNYRNTSDILYHVMNVFRQMGIDQEETLYFSGNIGRHDDLIPEFSSYVRDIKLAEPEGNFTFSYVFSESVLHRFLNLFSIVNCE